MKDKCSLCNKIAVTVLTINIPSEDEGIRQLITYRCDEHIDVDYNTAREIITKNVIKKLEALHEKSRNNKKLIANVKCGCFNCLETFESSAVVDFIDNSNTALCPRCGVDAVLASDTKVTVTIAMLTAMHKHYFSY